MAAVLACGGDGFLSHRSAAALWGIGSERGGVVEIGVRSRRRHRRAGMRCRNRPSLPADDLTRRLNIPVTTPARTLLDLAAVLPSKALERAVNEADKFDRIDPEALRQALERFAGEPGAKPLRRLLDRDTFRLSDSDLELYFRPIALAAELPQPQTKVWVNGFEVDFFWPQLGLLVEADSLRYHRTAATQARDQLRDQIHTAAGLRPLRFNHWQIRYEPDHVRRILSRTASHL